MVDGRTRGIPFPQKGWNCNPDYHLAQADPNVKYAPRSVEHCPDMNERLTLVDGRTRAIPFPAAGWNCNPDYHLAQVEADPNFKYAARSMEHCPDFDERMTLVDGLTRAIPFPTKGYNCNPDYHLAQADPNFKYAARSVEHCPDFDERFTLVDGLTRAVPFPVAGWNCNPDYHLAQVEANPNVKYAPRSVEHCPDFDERFTLVDGRTRAIAFPAAGWNCNPDYHLA